MRPSLKKKKEKEDDGRCHSANMPFLLVDE